MSLRQRDGKTAKRFVEQCQGVIYNNCTESKLNQITFNTCSGFPCSTSICTRACISISCVKSSTLVCKGLQYKQAAHTATGSPEGGTQISQSPAALRKAKL